MGVGEWDERISKKMDGCIMSIGPRRTRGHGEVQCTETPMMSLSGGVIFSGSVLF